jgi:hypothetical protein
VRIRNYEIYTVLFVCCFSIVFLPVVSTLRACLSSLHSATGHFRVYSALLILRDCCTCQHLLVLREIKLESPLLCSKCTCSPYCNWYLYLSIRDSFSSWENKRTSSGDNNNVSATSMRPMSVQDLWVSSLYITFYAV